MTNQTKMITICTRIGASIATLQTDQVVISTQSADYSTIITKPVAVHISDQ